MTNSQPLDMQSWSKGKAWVRHSCDSTTWIGSKYTKGQINGARTQNWINLGSSIAYAATLSASSDRKKISNFWQVSEVPGSLKHTLLNSKLKRKRSTVHSQATWLITLEYSIIWPENPTMPFVRRWFSCSILIHLECYSHFNRAPLALLIQLFIYISSDLILVLLSGFSDIITIFGWNYQI